MNAFEIHEKRRAWLDALDTATAHLVAHDCSDIACPAFDALATAENDAFGALREARRQKAQSDSPSSLATARAQESLDAPSAVSRAFPFSGR